MSVNVEAVAKDLRAAIRRKAGLEPDWDGASESMKAWYRMLAERTVKGLH
jgi:hypothetical protein